jgi:uncharacterized protein
VERPLVFRPRQSAPPTPGYDPAKLNQRLLEDGGASLQIILKVAEVCNIACTYCYFFFGGDDSHSELPPYIEPGTVDSLCDFLASAVSTYRLSKVTLIIHGGEPLMWKKRSMNDLFERARAACAGANFRLSTQTNGMLIDEEWIDILARNGSYVGVSLDGPPEVNDKYRLDKRGRGTYDRVMNGVSQLFEAHRHGRIPRPGVLSVLKPDLDVERTYQHFVQTIGFRNIDFILPIEDRDHFNPADAPRIAASVSTLFRLYCAETAPGIYMRFFNKIIRSLTLEPDYVESEYRYQAQRDIVFTVASNGDIGPDDSLRVNDGGIMSLGLNVRHSSLADIVMNERFAHLIDASFQLPKACTPCDFRHACGGGEIFHRYSAARGFDSPSVHCDALFAVHRDVVNVLKRTGVSAATIERRLNAAPQSL